MFENKKGKMAQSAKRRQERLIWLNEICVGKVDPRPLTDEELEFLFKYFRWYKGLRALILETRRRPFRPHPQGFLKKCPKCGQIENYCNC